MFSCTLEELVLLIFGSDSRRILVSGIMGGISILKLGDAGILSAKRESGTDDKRKEEELPVVLLKVWSEILKHFESPTFRLRIVVKNINGLS